MENKKAAKNQFLKKLQSETISLSEATSYNDGDWTVKGFIDIVKNIYTISDDTKVVSKILELLIFPSLCEFAERNNLKMVLAKEQNYYPDITFIDENDYKYAVDIKTTYRKDDVYVNGMTLGAFTGYFRDRNSTKNTTFPYNEYSGHFVLGVLYSKNELDIDEKRIYSISELHKIPSVINDITFFAQEKYKIAIDKPGSGNTKNIGSVNKIDELINGKGPFAELGEKIFNDYWQNYLTNDMARAAELKKPLYTNLEQYLKRIK